MRRKIMSIFACLLMIGCMIGNLSYTVKAADEECVDGSYLTYEDSSTVTVGPKTRGIYLLNGSSSILKAGTGKISAGGDTVATKVIATVGVNVRIERFVNGGWQRYTAWTKTVHNTAYVDTSDTFYVPTGYFYRVFATHYANSDVSDSFTNGIYI